jgi:hypothetical protein
MKWLGVARRTDALGSDDVLCGCALKRCVTYERTSVTRRSHTLVEYKLQNDSEAPDSFLHQ